MGGQGRAGRAGEIRACTGCNQGCYGNLTQGYPITCVTNPSVGREATLGSGTLRPAATPKRVVVVGGGPAGLEAAWVAAAHGHDVTLLERASELGGKIRLAAMLPGRQEMAAFADWRADECARRGVDVRLGVDADLDAVIALAPDAVIVATGGRAGGRTPSKSHPMPVAGSDQSWVIDHERALLEAESLGEHVVILDAVGHIEAIAVGHYLAERAHEVTVVTPLHSPLLLDAETMQKALPRAVRAGVRWRPNTAVVSIGDHEVTVADVMSYAIDTLPASHVVIRTHGVANDSLYYALQAKVADVRRVGDAVVPASPIARSTTATSRAGRSDRASCLPGRGPFGRRAVGRLGPGVEGQLADQVVGREAAIVALPVRRDLPGLHVLDRAAVDLERLAGDPAGFG